MSEDNSLTKAQHGHLMAFIHAALKEIRVLAWIGKSEQASHLATAIAPIPLMIGDNKFDWNAAGNCLAVYQRKYNAPSDGDYLKLLKKIEQSNS